MSFLVGVLAVGAGVIGAVLHVVNITAGRGVEPSFWLLSALGALAYGGVGAVLARRSRVPRIPLVLGAIGLGQALALVCREYALLGAVPLDQLALWLGSWLWAPSYIASAALLPLLLPDGFLPSRRWRPAFALSIVALAAQAVNWALLPYDLQDVPLVVRDLTNPVGTRGRGVAGGARHDHAADRRRGRPRARLRRGALASVERRPTAAAQVVARGRRGDRSSSSPSGSSFRSRVGEYVAALGALPIPLACGIAALRHRLWDVDLVVSVGLRYTMLSAVIIAVYAAVVALLGASTGAPVIATVVVAVVLLPLHSLLQRWTNRLVFGEPDDPVTALARLGERLEATSDPADVADRLLPEVAARVSSLLQSPYAAIRSADGAVVEHGDRPDDVDRVPLRYGGAEVGVARTDAARPVARRGPQARPARAAGRRRRALRAAHPRGATLPAARRRGP